MRPRARSNLTEVVAVYFPTHHRDERYDRWYGPGWNEWRLMEQARPLFPGHEQPKLCAWGSFDEADPRWMERQIDLAADHLGPTADGYIPRDEVPDNPDYRRLRIRYSGAIPGQPVTAFLRIPKRVKGSVPAVLCLHGHVAGCWLGKVWMGTAAIELTQQGFVTLAPDMFPFGERRDRNWDEFEWENGKGSAHFWGERAWFQTLPLRGQTLLGVHVWELQRALDILRSLPEVDPARIGAMGHSGGGVNTLWLAALDQRVACAVSSVGVQSYSRVAERRNPVAVWNLAPILTVGDTPEVLSLIAPRPFLGIEGVGDGDFDAGHNQQHVYPRPSQIYQLHGVEDRLKQSIHAGGHDYHETQRQWVYAWLERWLKPTAAMVEGTGG